MPYVIARPHKRFAALAASMLTLLVVASPAAADTGCQTAPTSPVFAQFGDTASYAPLQGVTFEGDMTGWSLNAAIVAGPTGRVRRRGPNPTRPGWSRAR